MDITTLAAWGEFLGGIAVVVSSTALAEKNGQNSGLVRTSNSSAAAQSRFPSKRPAYSLRAYWTDLQLAVAGKSRILSLIRRGL